MSAPSAAVAPPARTSNLEVVRGNKRNAAAVDELVKRLTQRDLTGSLYIGYPVVASLDQRVIIDALLTCREHGVVVFDFTDLSELVGSDALVRRHDDLYLAVEQQLKKSRALVERRRLAVEVHPISFSILPPDPEIAGDCLVATPENVVDVLDRQCGPITAEHLRLVNAAVQRATMIKPVQKRLGVQQPGSYGAKIREIEREIANLDRWQKSAAIEMPDGPQRIRGLAGSGKTIVLALKAAYLHASQPDWTVAVTFWTRSLYQQFKDRVRRFSFEHLGDEPDWERLRVLHAWGSGRAPGFYSTVAQAADLPLRDYLTAKREFGAEQPFEGACQELLDQLSGTAFEPLYDAVLIDEAQDLPPAFFELVHTATREPKRIVWAYDELQNLSRHTMAPLSELFGRDAAGHPRLEQLHDRPGEPRRDLILPRCYRNTPWALTTAHALGFGIYRPRGLVQFFHDPELWEAVGYEVVSGSLQPGRRVVLRRRSDATPEYFERLLHPEDALETHCFPDRERQVRWVAEKIHENVTEDELEARDILVIFPNPLTINTQAAPLIRELARRKLASHLAGVTSSRDELFVEDSVALSGIYRAKGNEAPMVYILDSDYCYGGLELIKRRNTLFTAITRSRAWVRICGCGKAMEGLVDEIGQVTERSFKLDFVVPTEEELARLRKIHRDRPPEEQSQVARVQGGLQDLIRMLESGDLAIENLDPELLERLGEQLKTSDR